MKASVCKQSLIYYPVKIYQTPYRNKQSQQKIF